MKTMGILIVLAVNTWSDIRRKQISMLSVVVLSVAGIAGSFLKSGSGQVSLLGFVPGIVAAVLSLAAHGAVGMGDALLLLALGTVLTVEELTKMLCVALVFCALTALVLMVMFRKRRDMTLPFVPFLMAGYIGGLII